MSLFLKLFNTTAEYNAYTADTAHFILPNVSLIEETNVVAYNPYVPPYSGFCKLYLNDGSEVEIQGSGTLNYNHISQYQYTCVSAEIGTQCTVIGYAAFNDDSGSMEGFPYLSSVTISNTVTSIGNYAFNNCSGLTSIDIPDSVTSIGNGAFCTCYSLTSCTIGSSVTSIGDGAFLYCSSLTSIVSNATTAPLIQSTTFLNVKTGGTLTVPIGSSGYDTWMQNANDYLGLYGWTKVEQ